MKCKKATKEMLPAIMNLVAEAQEFLKEQGIDQWQDGYPNESVIMEDIEKNASYVFCENSQIMGYLTVVLGPEEVYDNLVEGEFLNQAHTEGAMHHVMMAKACRGKGLAAQLFDQAFSVCSLYGKESIRIDTHPDNLRMQHLIKKQGFSYCGKIELSRSHDWRFVYEKML